MIEEIQIQARLTSIQLIQKMNQDIHQDVVWDLHVHRALRGWECFYVRLESGCAITFAKRCFGSWVGLYHND